MRVWQPARPYGADRAEARGAFLAFERGGGSVYTAGAEGITRRVDAASDEVRGTWKASEDWIHSFAMSPDGNTLASGDWSGAVKLWSAGEDGLRPKVEPAQTR